MKKSTFVLLVSLVAVVAASAVNQVLFNGNIIGNAILVFTVWVASSFHRDVRADEREDMHRAAFYERERVSRECTDRDTAELIRKSHQTISF